MDIIFICVSCAICFFYIAHEIVFFVIKPYFAKKVLIDFRNGDKSKVYTKDMQDADKHCCWECDLTYDIVDAMKMHKLYYAETDDYSLMSRKKIYYELTMRGKVTIFTKGNLRRLWQ